MGFILRQQQLLHQHHRPLKCQAARPLYLVWQPLLDQGCPVFTVTSRKKKVKVKFVRTDITYSGNSHPIFTNINAMFVNLTDDNADRNSMMALVQSEYGPNLLLLGMMVCRIRIVSNFFFHVRQDS